MARLPQPGGDKGNWGVILNDYLSQALQSDGTLKDGSVGSSQLSDNAVTAAKLAPGSVTKATVGLTNVNNTADENKPVSTATQSALDAKATISSLATVATSGSYADLSNKPTIPTVLDADNTTKGVVKLAGDLGGTADAPTVIKTYSKTDVGLGNVDNTSDMSKPVSTAQQTALNTKQASASLEADIAAKLGTAGSLDAALSASFTNKWKANSVYTTGQVVIAPNGGIVKASSDFTSTGTYNAANWLPADGLGVNMTAIDYDAASAFRTQQDGRLSATYSKVSDSLTLQRLDRQSLAATRKNGADATIAYADATELSKDWSDLTGWSNTNVQVSGNKLYAVASSGTTGAIKSFSVATGGIAHLTGLIYWKAGGSAPIYVGIDLGTADHAPVNLSPDGLFIGFNGSGARAVFAGSNNSGISFTIDTTQGSNPTIDTTYMWNIEIGLDYIGFAMRKLGDQADLYSAFISRAAIVTAGKSINNISLFISDGRGVSGHALSPIVAVKSAQAARTKLLGGQTIEGVDHRYIATAASSGGDAWRIQLPATYDARRPSPLVIFCHQSVSGTSTTPWSDSRMQPVTKALSDAGFILASATDGGDRWGNANSLSSYQALYTSVRSTYNVGAFFMLGISMGSLSVLNSLVRRSLPTPAAVCTVGGVVDLDVLWANNTGSFAASIRSAYGIATDGSDYYSKTAGYNPVSRAGWEYRGVPMRFYTSAGDTTVPRATNQDILSSKVTPYAPEATVSAKSGAHLDVSQYPPSEIVSFFQTYL